MLKNIGYFLVSSGVVGLGSFSYLAYVARSNRKRYEKNMEDEENKDTTRPQYDYFGINWGAKADMMVGVDERADTR